MRPALRIVVVAVPAPRPPVLHEIPLVLLHRAFGKLKRRLRIAFPMREDGAGEHGKTVSGVVDGISDKYSARRQLDSCRRRGRYRQRNRRRYAQRCPPTECNQKTQAVHSAHEDLHYRMMIWNPGGRYLASIPDAPTVIRNSSAFTSSPSMESVHFEMFAASLQFLNS